MVKRAAAVPFVAPQFPAPCGKCTWCRIQKRKQWAIRVLHEASYHQKKAFLTMTYDDEHVPTMDDGQLTLQPRDLTNFFKRLRRQEKKFKYFACGEYGSPEETTRPHYHAILMGDEPDWKDVERGLIFKGDYKEAWYHGNIFTGTVTQDSIEYVAGYVNKKVYGKNSRDHYQGRQPEYKVSSNELGYKYLVDNLEDIIYTNELYHNGEPFPIPRYYLEKIESKLKHLLTKDQLAIFYNERLHGRFERERDQMEKLTGERLSILETDLTERYSLYNHEKQNAKAYEALLKARDKRNSAKARHKTAD